MLAGLPVRQERGRIVVDEAMRVPDVPGVWALGDNALVPNRAAKDGTPSPPTAQYALRQGRQLAGNIAAAIREQPRPFAFGGLGLLSSSGTARVSVNCRAEYGCVGGLAGCSGAASTGRTTDLRPETPGRGRLGARSARAD